MNIVEVTETLHGESPYSGLPCLLVRFAGCNLKCPYCDTPHDKFSEWSLDKLVKVINESKLKSVLITGGEPFIQENLELMLIQIRKDKKVVIETNGYTDISNERVYAFGNCVLVVDVKLFDNLKWFNPLNLKKIGSGDVLKFVFWDEASFNLGCEFLEGNESLFPWGLKLVFSPTEEMIKLGKVKGYAEKVIELQKKSKNQEVILQTQLHKILGVK